MGRFQLPPKSETEVRPAICHSAHQFIHLLQQSSLSQAKVTLAFCQAASSSGEDENTGGPSFTEGVSAASHRVGLPFCRHRRLRAQGVTVAAQGHLFILWSVNHRRLLYWGSYVSSRGPTQPAPEWSSAVHFRWNMADETLI